MPDARGIRERARAEITAEILAAARRQLATEGAPGLSLRAVAREVGMVSSAVYRYVASRDDLLTMLIIESYESLGAAVEAASARARRRAPAHRFLAAARAVRSWAIEHPHEYALLYGSPVPGYAAPETTIGPASRTTLALVGIVADAARDDRLELAGTARRRCTGGAAGRSRRRPRRRRRRPPRRRRRGDAGCLDAAVRSRELRALRPDAQRDRAPRRPLRRRRARHGPRRRSGRRGYQRSQWRIVSSGSRFAGLKSVPIV